MLSTEFPVTDRPNALRGTLNVYCRRAGGLGDQGRHAALLLTSYTALALAHCETAQPATPQHNHHLNGLVITPRRSAGSDRWGLLHARSAVRRAHENLDTARVNLERAMVFREGVDARLASLAAQADEAMRLQYRSDE